MANIGDTTVVTGEVRLSYVNVVEAKKFNESDKAGKYSVTVLIPKTTDDGKKTYERTMAAFNKAAEKGKDKHFGGRLPATFSHILKDGDTEVDDLSELRCKKNPELEGHWYLRVSSNYQPKVLGPDGMPVQDLLNDIYSGIYARVSYTAFAYSGQGRRGVSAVLNNIKITRAGEPLVTFLDGDEFNEQ